MKRFEIVSYLPHNGCHGDDKRELAGYEEGKVL